MELGGNKTVNSIFEASDVSSVKPNAAASLLEREKFIRCKYVDKMFFEAKHYDAVGKEETSMKMISAPSTPTPMIKEIIQSHHVFSPVDWDAVTSQQNSTVVTTKRMKDQLSLSLHSHSRVRRGDLSQSRHSQCVSRDEKQQEKNQSGTTYQTSLNDEQTSLGRGGSTHGSRVTSRRNSTRPRSRSSSRARKPSMRRLMSNSNLSTKTNKDESDDSLGASSFAMIPDDSSPDHGQEDSLQTSRELCDSFRPIKISESEEGKGSVAQTKGGHRVPRRGRGLDRAISVPNLQPRAKSQARRREDSKQLKKEESCKKLTDCVSAVKDKQRSETSPEVEKQRQQLSSSLSSKQRSRSASRTGAPERRQRPSTSLGPRRRQGSASKNNQRSPRSRSGDRPRRRGPSNSGSTPKRDPSPPGGDVLEDNHTPRKSANEQKTRNSSKPRSSRRSEQVCKNLQSEQSKSMELGDYFSGNNGVFPGVSNVKPDVITEVRKTLIKRSTWMDGDFSDDDLFAGSSEQFFEEEESPLVQATTLCKDLGPSGAIYPPLLSFDIAAVTFYS